MQIYICLEGYRGAENSPAHLLPQASTEQSTSLVSGTDCHLTLRRPRHCLHSRDASRLNCLHGAIPIALDASDFPFRLLVDAVTHVLSVFRVCKVPQQSSDNYVTLICSFMMMMMICVLGVVLSSTLKFTGHVESLLNKVS